MGVVLDFPELVKKLIKAIESGSKSEIELNRNGADGYLIKVADESIVLTDIVESLRKVAVLEALRELIAEVASDAALHFLNVKIGGESVGFVEVRHDFFPCVFVGGASRPPALDGWCSSKCCNCSL